MRLRGGNHGATAAAKTFTVAVMAAAIFAQLLSLSHEMTVRHFRCAEHGELTHVASLARGPAAELPSRRTHDAVPRARRRGGRRARALRRRLHRRGELLHALDGRRDRHGRRRRPRSVRRLLPVSWAGGPFVLASAPKTSPPSA